MRLFGRSIKLSVLLLAVVILLIFLHQFRILLPIENLLVRILSPIQNQIYVLGVKINNFYSNTGFNKDLVKTNSELEQKFNDLVIENSQLKTMLLEQQEIERQYNFLQEAGLEAVVAKIIGRSLQADYQTLIVNKGEIDGVRVGLPVIASDGAMVGKIAEVNTNSSQVLLINDSHSSLAATIQNESLTKGVVVGERGLSLKMELIPQDEEIGIGEVVVTSGLEADIPRGLVIGQIEQVTSEPNGFFQTAFLDPLANPDDLVVVSILKYHD